MRYEKGCINHTSFNRNVLWTGRPRPGIDYFPHTGFFDFVVNALSHPWDGTTSTSLISEYNSKGWYLDSLKDLGLTNIVTDGQYHLDNLQSLRHSFFLNDMGFQWKNKTWANPPVIFTPAEYLNSLGHDVKDYPLEFGGDIAGSINKLNNFGFTTAGGSGTCYWGMQPNYQPPLDATGANIDETINTTLHSSRYSKVNSHDRGVMLWGVLPWTQLADPSLWYKMRIYLRMEDVPTNEEEIFTINISNWTGNTDDPQLELRRDYFRQIAAQTGPIGLTQVVMNTAITDTNDYVWFESNAFQVSQDMDLGFYIYWHGNASIYIDKITFVSTQFAELYVDSTISVDEIATTLFNRYPNGDLTSTKFQSFYADEPFQLSALYRKELQSKIYQKATSVNATTLELNGATGGVPAYFLEFERNYAKPVGEEAKRSIIYNIYPIDANTTIGQTSIQHRLDVLINYGNFGESEDYQFSGLKRAQMAAQNFTLDIQSDDIPLIFTMGVHSEQYVTGSPGSPVYVSGPHSRRAPTWSEIFAQGNLALAYGAKGFMYYMIPTRAKPPVLKFNPNLQQYYYDTVWNTYGLFDAVGEVYDTSHSTMNGSVQHPEYNQIKNKRFFAVKSFISSIKPIESTLLGLRWKDAKSWHDNSSCSENWIANVSTRYPYFGKDDDSNKTFVETGYFVEKSPPSGKIEDAKFIYLVNRRCNLQPENSPDNLEEYADTSCRNVRFYLNFPNSTWDYYTVTDLKTDSVYFTTKTGAVTIFLGAGEGTLLKIEPQITNITQNDTLGYNTTFYSDLTVSNNATLTITGGTTLTFKNHSRLILSNGNLNVVGTAQEPVVFDFVVPYWQSTQNGIVNNNGNVVLNHARIKNAGIGYYSYTTDNDDIQNCEIFNNYWGIVMHWTHSYGTEKAKIVNCNIHDNATWDNQGRGITLSNSSPKIYATTIRKNDYGLYCVTNSNPYDTTDETYSYNIIDSNGVGILSYYSSPMLGYVDNDQGGILISGGGNTIKNNSIFNVMADTNCNVYVERNYWGTKDPALFNIYSVTGSIVYTDYYLDDPPTGSIHSGLASKVAMKIDDELISQSQGRFTSGTNMMKPSTVTSTTETLPLEYQLFNNFPNPFNPETMIKFSLKERSSVTLDVYNIAGQKVAELIGGEMEKGMYEKRFNGMKFSSGVYIFRIEALSLESRTTYSKTLKAMLLK